ncbi:MAG: hypothetical protein ACE5EU_03380 [Paracoccaceae bacterium]
MRLTMPVVVLGGLLAASPAAAHSFRLGLVAPFSGPEASAGQQALDGLRLATRERDGHPDETSDGHLGGLDSYLVPLDSAAGDAAALRRQADELRLDIVTTAGPVPGLGAALGGASAEFCPPGPGPVPAGRLADPEAAAFVAAFRRAFGRDPTPAAARGCNAGRAVDAAVRALGDKSGKAALARLCPAGN